MIYSFSNKQTENIFHGIHPSPEDPPIPSEIVKIAQERLDLLNGTDRKESLEKVPSIRSGISHDEKGNWSLPIEGGFRLSFHWKKDGPCDVQIQYLRD